MRRSWPTWRRGGSARRSRSWSAPWRDDSAPTSASWSPSSWPTSTSSTSVSPGSTPRSRSAPALSPTCLSDSTPSRASGGAPPRSSRPRSASIWRASRPPRTWRRGPGCARATTRARANAAAAGPAGATHGSGRRWWRPRTPRAGRRRPISGRSPTAWPPDVGRRRPPSPSGTPSWSSPTTSPRATPPTATSAPPTSTNATAPPSSAASYAVCRRSATRSPSNPPPDRARSFSQQVGRRLGAGGPCHRQTVSGRADDGAARRAAAAGAGAGGRPRAARPARDDPAVGPGLERAEDRGVPGQARADRAQVRPGVPGVGLGRLARPAPPRPPAAADRGAPAGGRAAAGRGGRPGRADLVGAAVGALAGRDPRRARASLVPGPAPAPAPVPLETDQAHGPAQGRSRPPGAGARRPGGFDVLTEAAARGAHDLFYLDQCGFAPTMPPGYTWAREGVRPLLRDEAPQGRRVNVLGAFAPVGPRPRFVHRS